MIEPSAIADRTGGRPAGGSQGQPTPGSGATDVAPADATARPPRPRGALARAGTALCVVEAARLLRHPAVWVGVLLAVLPWLYEWVAGDSDAGPPVLHDADRATQANLLVLGAGALVASHLAVLRSHRHDTERLYRVLPLPRSVRAAAHLGAALPLGVLGSVLVAARMIGLAGVPDAAGRPDPAELAAGPILVVLLAAVGVLLGYLAPRAVAAGPLAVLVLATGSYALWSSTSRLRWLGPYAAEHLITPLPANLLGRPAGAHLAYLGGVTVLIGALTLVLAGAVRVAAPAAAVAGALVVVTALIQIRPVDAELTARRVAATERPASLQTCERRNVVTLCAFPDFVPWTAVWDEVVQGVLRAVPADRRAALPPLVVRQRVPATDALSGGRELPMPPVAAWHDDDLRAGRPDPVDVGTSWSPPSGILEFAAGFAQRVVSETDGDGPAGDGPGAGTGPVGGTVRLCGARGVVVGWLAARATSQATDAYRYVVSHSSGDLVLRVPGFSGGLLVGRGAVSTVSSLLALPAGEVTDRLAAGWPELTAPTTSTERAAALLGVASPAADTGAC